MASFLTIDNSSLLMIDNSYFISQRHLFDEEDKLLPKTLVWWNGLHVNQRHLFVEVANLLEKKHSFDEMASLLAKDIY